MLHYANSQNQKINDSTCLEISRIFVGLHTSSIEYRLYPQAKQTVEQ